MKQIIRLYTLLVVSCLLLAGCNSNENVGDLGDPVAVQFGMGEIPRLKTTAGGDQWTLNDPVGIFMVKNGQPLNSSNIAEGADNVEYKAQTGGNAISGFIPVSGTPIFYPQNGDNVDFVAYYPYKSSLTNYTYPVNVSNQATPADIDVLYANTNRNQSGSGYNKHSGTVDLQFNHVLSKLSFTLTPGAGSPDLTGIKIEITNLATTADIDLTDGTVISTNSGQTLTANTATNGLSSSTIVIPQTLSGTKLIVTLADNLSKFEWNFTTTEFLEGKNHQYTIAVSKTGITVSSSGITTWTGTGDPATPGMAETLTQYRVGDYYPDPTISSTAIGVVFWLDPNAPFYNSSVPASGYFGKIVSLNQQNYVPWGDNNIDEQAAGVQYIRNSSDGSQGTFNLISKRKDQSDFSTTYGAFNWIYQKNNYDINGIWYMPAIDELKTLYNIQGTINPKITSAGGVAVYYYYYFSSTEYASNGAYIIDMETGIVYSNPGFMSKGSGSDRYVRAIAKF